ncbi:histidine kinase OS=Streptomyces alboniger OX=132473 GN=CP975_26515 PE=4 SV=1 [Streptomyces alboniger]
MRCSRPSRSSEGKLTERLESGASEGSWATAIDASNALVDDLVRPVSEVGRVLSAVADGDLEQRMELRAQGSDGNGHPLRGEFLKVGRTVNNLVDQLSTFTDEVTRVASEVGTEGKLGGQARVRGMSGSWKDLTDSVNTMAYRLTAQVRDIALVTTAVAKGDLSRKVTVHVAGEMLELKNTVNTMVDQLSSFSSEVTRVAREVGTEGELGGQAQVPGVAGVWKDLTDSVNLMAGNLTAQVRGIAQVTTAVANGDLSQKVTVSARGEVAQLAETINQMTETLRTFADEVTRVANEVGAEGQLGGQANVPGAAGTWKDLTDSVNTVFRNLTTQVRDIAQVTTAVANGDLSQKVTVDVAGEMLELKNTVNTMVDQLSAFGSEVTRVAREIGVEGELGGQAQVQGAAGTWKDLTDSVNTAFRNLTGQVRNIAQVTTAVANGDLSQKVTVDVSGEMLQLKNTVNTMVDQLSSFADQVTRMARDVGTEGRLGGQARVDGVSGTWKDLTDSVNFMAGNLTSQVRQIAQVTTAVARGDLSQKIEVDARGRDPGAEEHHLRMLGSYGYSMGSMPTSFRPGETLIGTAAKERRTILVENAPSGYLRIASGLGEAPPAQVIVLPVLFEGTVLGVIELAAFQPFTQIQKDFLNQIAEMIATSVNTISVNTKTEVLLKQSRGADRATARALGGVGEAWQKALQDSNAELEEKAELLAQQNRDIEVKNTEIEEARQVLEERAEQLAVSMRYKSEFLANMSHELRTPLNSLLILAKLLADNADSNLTPKQVEFAETIHGAGSDLLQLINDILDLSKVEAGKMDVSPTRIALVQLVDYVEATFRPLTAEKGLDFSVRVSPELPATLHTDEQRLLQVLRNLLSNAVKFTDSGAVELVIRHANHDVPDAIREQLLEAGSLRDAGADLIAFSVTDTGIGIAASKMRVIFEAFKQADGTTSRKYGGTGLGLSISREIARLLGGEIYAQSEPGRGSTFTLYLPLHPSELPPQGYAQLAPAPAVPELPALEEGAGAEATAQAEGARPRREAPAPPASLFRRRRRPAPAPEQPALPGPQPGAAAPEQRTQDQWPAAGQETAAEGRTGIHFGGEKVLIVDDDIRNVFALTSVLEQHGLSVLYAENGREGIEVLEQHDDVTVVLMDIMMPEMDGYATTTAIRRMPQFAGLPIIALTAKAMKGDREKAIDSGASDYVTKPVDPDHLLSVMEQWMRGQ